ncbi:MAG: DUF3500 domain-containing protein [Planctomycetota bacterium]|nr:MAG: DUF3500 domain-containing protein [Planctomycetota bacterium]
MRHALAAILAVALMGAVLWGQGKGSGPDPAVEMARAANAFLMTLGDAERERATFGFDDPERLNWHFIPRPRKGLPLRDMSRAAERAAHRLIATGLSEIGYDQALKVMSLEEVLYLLEGGDREQRRERRDPRKYYISIFGTPSERGTWGWRVEGHHLSLNYTIRDGVLISTTPEFFGANPSRIDAGPGRTVRVLGPEEDLARALLRSLSEPQRERAWVSREAPDDLRGGGKPQPETSPPVGIPAADMTPPQRQLLRQLLTEYLANMPDPVAEQRRAAINRAGPENIYFAWWGSDQPNQRHYYRVQGPTFLIEFNNTQNSANHVHSMWRNMAGDFGIPLK